MLLEDYIRREIAVLTWCGNEPVGVVITRDIHRRLKEESSVPEEMAVLCSIGTKPVVVVDGPEEAAKVLELAMADGRDVMYITYGRRPLEPHNS